MAINTYRFWMATDANRLLANQTSFIAASSPIFYQGNVANLELHIVASSGVGNTPVELPFPSGSSITVAIGETNAYPTGGTWHLLVNGIETDNIAYNALPSVVETALNDLEAVSSAGGVTVSKIGDAYNITWNTFGTKPLIEQGSDALTPASYLTVILVQSGTSELKEILFVELRQNPIALSNTWTALPNPEITNEIIQAWDGSTKIYRVNIDPQPKSGSFNIFYNNVSYTFRTNVTADEIAGALNLQVFNTGFFQWDIVLTANTTLETSGTLIGYNGYSGSINLSTAECHQFLNGEARKATTIEVSINVDEKKYTLLQTSCVISSDVITDGAISPLPLGTPISNDQANARFVRRDADQNPNNNTINQIWKNLGTSTLNGVNIATAISSSNAPGPGNAFATMTDLGSVQSVWGDIIGTLSDQNDLQSALDGKLSLTGGTVTGAVVLAGQTEFGGVGASVLFDSIDVSFGGNAVRFNNGDGEVYISGSGVQFADSTIQNTAGLPLTGGTVTGGVAFDTAEEIVFDAPTQFNNTNNFGGGLNTASIYFNADSTTQTTAGLPLTGGTMTGDITLNSNTVYMNSIDVPSGDVFNSNLKFDGLKLGVSNSGEPETYILITPAYIRYPDNTTQVTAALPLIGGTMTGKLNVNRGTGNVPLNLGITGTPTTYSNGDVWISGLDMRFRDSAGATKVTASLSNSNSFSTYQSISSSNNSNPALKITQLGTGEALRVEDETSPDATAFVVSNNGRVGIGIAPDASVALSVDSTGIKFNGSTAQTVPFLPPPSDGNYYVYRNGAWLAATIYTHGGHNYLTV